jgi:myo-inositol-1(or 4)-monophosphatase
MKTPELAILTEESGEHHQSKVGRWIIDPLDGTTNYAHKIPIVSVSIALELDGILQLGLVYQPFWNDTYYAIKDQKAFHNKKKIHVSTVTELDKSLLLTGFPYDLRQRPDYPLSIFRAFALRTQAIRRCGSAALDLCFLASGRADGFWELSLHPWDTAAGIVIVEAAGGKVSTFNGSPYNPFLKEILASNGIIHQEMLETISSIK